MRLLWLPEVLANAGLEVHLYPGWETRGADTYGPVRGIICHGTAGSLTSTDAGELRVIAITGSNTASPPIAELYLSRSGAWWVVASGTCTGVKTGTAGPLAGYSDDAVLQIEAQHSTTEPWTETQYRSYVRGVAALCAHREPGYDVPVERVAGHYEHQPTEKTDPWFDMNQFRRDVQAVLNGDDMSAERTSYNADHYLWRGVMSLDDVVDGIRVDDNDPSKTGQVDNQFARMLKQMKLDVAELKARPPVQSAPVDAAALKAVLLDPAVLAAIAKAVTDEIGS